MLSPWGAVGVCSRRGAAHRRRGQPCQDASLALRLVSPQGEPLLLLAVADGHGAAAHSRSEVGSALACRAAAAALEEALEGGSLEGGLEGDNLEESGQRGERLRRWLAEGWPAAVQRHWRQGTQAHWLSLPGGAAGPYSPIPYGTTLGLLLLAPRWWAYAGLGDWDLVRIPTSGSAELLSQERALPGKGEATHSLCQEGSPLVGWRAGLEPLAADSLPFALLLSSDGVRKSCASDGDFLALCPWLAALVLEDGGEAPAAGGPEPAGEGSLAAALDRISAEGCGDDGTVAIAHWAPFPSLPSAGAGVGGGVGRRGPGRGGPARFGPGRLGPGRLGPARLGPGRLGFGLVGFALLGLGLGVMAFRALGPGRLPPAVALPGLPPRSAPPEPGEPWRREVQRLCRGPALVGPSLVSRRSQVEALRRGSLRPEALLAERSRDPLGALIAAGFPAIEAETLRQSGFQRLPLCPELRRGLAQLWTPPPPVPADAARPMR